MRVDDEWDGILEYLCEHGEVTSEMLGQTMQNEERAIDALEELETMGFVEQTADGWQVPSEQFGLQ